MPLLSKEASVLHRVVVRPAGCYVHVGIVFLSGGLSLTLILPDCGCRLHHPTKPASVPTSFFYISFRQQTWRFVLRVASSLHPTTVKVLPYLHYIFDFIQVLDFAGRCNPSPRRHTSRFRSLLMGLHHISCKVCATSFCRNHQPTLHVISADSSSGKRRHCQG